MEKPGRVWKIERLGVPFQGGLLNQGSDGLLKTHQTVKPGNEIFIGQEAHRRKERRAGPQGIDLI